MGKPSCEDTKKKVKPTGCRLCKHLWLHADYRVDTNGHLPDQLVDQEQEINFV